MGKTELLDIILKDIKELEVLVKGMAEMSEVPAIVQNLAKIQARNIFDGLSRINDVEASVLKSQLSNVENLADRGVAAQPIVVEENISSVEPVEEKIVQVVETKKPQELEIEVKIEAEEKPSEVFVEQAKEFEPQETVALEEKKSEEIIETKIVQPVENEEELTIVETPIEKNVEQEKEKGTDIAITEVKETQEKFITNERFRTGVRSLNETIQVRKPETRFVVSLKKAINLNDRFRYQRELFSNNSSAMNAAIERLDAMDSLAEAKQYVAEFGWNENNEAVADFMALLEARFSHAN